MRRWLSMALAVACCVPALGQQYLEIKSPHFAVVTDAGEQRGREIAQHFEEMRASFGILFGLSRVNLPTPLTILAVRDTKDFQQLAPRYNSKPVALTGFFRGATDRDFIVLDTSAPDPERTVYHEYAHLLLNGNLIPMPVWFDEGFAEYCSSLRVTPKQIEFGLLRNDLLEVLRTKAWMHVFQLFSVTHSSPEYNEGNRRSLFYAQSWLTVHYLMANHLTAQTNQFIDLVQNRHMDINQAIRQAYSVEPNSFENAVHNYFDVQRFTFFRAPAPAGLTTEQFEMRTLSASDWLATIADLNYHSPDAHEEGVAQFRKLLQTDPGNVLANRELGYAYLQQNEFDKAAASFEQASKGDPKDARLHYYIALLAQQQSSQSGKPPADLAGIVQHLKAAVEIDPNYGEAYQLLSWAEAMSGERAAARESIEKAVELKPRNDLYALTLAQYEVQDKQYDKVRPLLERLAGSQQPEVARYAVQALNTMERPATQSMDMPRQPITAPQWQTKNASVEDLEAKPEPKPEGPEQVLPIQYLKGELVRIDCSQKPAAIITFQAKGKSWTMFTRDRTQLVIIGADGLSCDWTNRKAAVNYRMQADGRGELVSLEVE